MRSDVSQELLKYVNEQHHAGILGNFVATIETRIAELRVAKPKNPNIAFFEYLLSKVDAGEYDSFRHQWLADYKPERDRGLAKYLDPIVWFESKIRIARALNLHKTPPMKILDLGTGPAHFPVVARFYGHDVVGTDLPARSGGVDATGHLYDSLCDLYRVKRFSLVIKSNEPLGDLGGPYDLVTALLAAFNVDAQKQPWSIDAWRFFLSDLKDGVLVDNGSVFLMLADNKLTPEVWTYLASRGQWSVEKSKQVYISDLKRLNAI